jgi:hypothetical protein
LRNERVDISVVNLDSAKGLQVERNSIGSSNELDNRFTGGMPQRQLIEDVRVMKREISNNKSATDNMFNYLSVEMPGLLIASARIRVN